jgi:hypothetical protein
MTLRKSIEKFIKKYSTILTFIGAVLLILTQTGFRIDIPEFYKSLDVESKILFVGLLNFLITIVAAVYISGRENR